MGTHTIGTNGGVTSEGLYWRGLFCGGPRWLMIGQVGHADPPHHNLTEPRISWIGIPERQIRCTLRANFF